MEYAVLTRLLREEQRGNQRLVIFGAQEFFRLFFQLQQYLGRFLGCIWVLCIAAQGTEQRSKLDLRHESYETVSTLGRSPAIHCVMHR